MGNRLGEGLHGDEEPTVKELSNFTASVLAKQGRLPAQPGKHEPTLLLVLQWGYLRPESDDLLWFLGYNPDNDVAAIDPDRFSRRGSLSPRHALARDPEPFWKMPGIRSTES